MEQEFPFSNSHQLLLPSQLAGNLLFKSQVEAQQGEEHHLCSAETLLLPKDKLDTYSKYTRSQNMRPPALEAMVSRRGDKAEACGAWQQSGQINHCPLYSQREKNGAIQEQIHLSLWGFTRVSEKPHGQQSLSAGTQESSRISMETWCFIHCQELHCQGAVFTACVLPGWAGLESTWRLKVCAVLPLPKTSGGKQRQDKKDWPFSSQSERFLDVKETSAYLTASYHIPMQNVLKTHLANIITTSY